MLRLESRNGCRVALNWTPVGKRAVGRPKDTWRRMVVKERKAFGWKSWNEAARKATEKRNGAYLYTPNATHGV